MSEDVKTERQGDKLLTSRLRSYMSLHSILGYYLTRGSYGTVQAMATGFKGHWKLLYVLLFILIIIIINIYIIIFIYLLILYFFIFLILYDF